MARIAIVVGGILVQAGGLLIGVILDGGLLRLGLGCSLVLLAGSIWGVGGRLEVCEALDPTKRSLVRMSIVGSRCGLGGRHSSSKLGAGDDMAGRERQREIERARTKEKAGSGCAGEK